MNDEVKDYIDEKVGDLRKELHALRKEITDNIATPLSSNLSTIADVIDKHEEMTNRIDRIEQGSGTINPIGSGNDLPSLEEIMDDSLNMMAIPFVESMKFVVMVSGLVERKLELVQVKDKIINDYGTIMGRLYLETLNDVVQQTSKKNLKKACADILGMLRGTTGGGAGTASTNGDDDGDST